MHKCLRPSLGVTNKLKMRTSYDVCASWPQWSECRSLSSVSFSLACVCVCLWDSLRLSSTKHTHQSKVTNRIRISRRRKYAKMLKHLSRSQQNSLNSYSLFVLLNGSRSLNELNLWFYLWEQIRRRFYWKKTIFFSRVHMKSPHIFVGFTCQFNNWHFGGISLHVDFQKYFHCIVTKYWNDFQSHHRLNVNMYAWADFESEHFFWRANYIDNNNTITHCLCICVAFKLY